MCARPLAATFCTLEILLWHEVAGGGVEAGRIPFSAAASAAAKKAGSFGQDGLLHPVHQVLVVREGRGETDLSHQVKLGRWCFGAFSGDW
jgi:hypothetical protein